MPRSGLKEEHKTCNRCLSVWLAGQNVRFVNVVLNSALALQKNRRFARIARPLANSFSEPGVLPGWDDALRPRNLLQTVHLNLAPWLAGWLDGLLAGWLELARQSYLCRVVVA